MNESQKTKIYICYYNLIHVYYTQQYNLLLYQRQRDNTRISMADLKITIFRSVAQFSSSSSCSSCSSSSFIFLDLSAGLKVNCLRDRSQARWGTVFQITPRAKEKKCSRNDAGLCHILAVRWRGLARYRLIETNKIIRDIQHFYNFAL